ncbi:MAG: PmoA family protein [Gemmataceae bacterium]|nr:PmoA family protein [Gemmataceae bacterium]
MKTIAVCLALALALAFGLAPMPAAQPAKVTIKPSRKHIDFRVGDELITTYHIGEDWAKPFFWPVNAPGGIPLTRAWPIDKSKAGESTDHPHQKSLWFCWGDVIPEGIEIKHKLRNIKGIDFWAEGEGRGRIVCTHVGEPQTGKSTGSITTKNEWRTADGEKVLDETRTIRLYDFGKARLLVLDIDLHASVVPIVFGDTKEGAMGARVQDSMRADKVGKGKIENADGKIGERDQKGPVAWGQVSRWCDYSGPVGGKTVGLAILDDPKNPHPAAWHSRGYGLMAANPFGRAKSGFPALKGRDDLVRLARGEHIRFRYGVLLHTGDTQQADVAGYYDRFVKLRGRD